MRRILLARRRPLLLAVIALVLSLALFGRFRTIETPSGDSQTYLLAGYNISTHGVFSDDRTDMPAPTLGREPGYGLVLAVLMRAGTSLAEFRPACLTAPGQCPATVYDAARWANLIFVLAAAALLGWVAWRLTGEAWAGACATAYIALNAHMLKGRWEVLSDHFALLLLTLMLAALLRWWERPSAARALAAGVAAAALILTKAVFLYALLLGGCAGLVALLLTQRRRIGSAALLLAAAWLPVLGWMARNAAVAGEFALTDNRSGIALSTREVFNHMGPQELLCAFLYWTRGTGDGWAQLLFAPEVWQPFQIDWPNGYYDIGQNRYEPWVKEVAATNGITLAEARGRVDRELLSRFLERPGGWLASLPALIYRGLWIDEFVLVGAPAAVAATLWAVRRRRVDWLILLGVGWFNLGFYAAVSLNIPRYQVTALPTMALGAAWLAALLARRGAEFSRRRAAAPRGGSPHSISSSPA